MRGLSLSVFILLAACKKPDEKVPDDLKPTVDARLDAATKLANDVLEKCPAKLTDKVRGDIGKTANPAAGTELASDDKVLQVNVWCMYRDGNGWDGAEYKDLKTAEGPTEAAEGKEYFLTKEGEHVVKVVQPSIVVGEDGAFDLTLFVPDDSDQRAVEMSVTLKR